MSIGDAKLIWGGAAVMGCGQIDKALQGKSVFIKLFYNDLYNLNDSFGRS